MLSAETIQRLKELAQRDCWADAGDLCVDDYAGGNMDDAYIGGVQAGETMLARGILAGLHISWEK